MIYNEFASGWRSRCRQAEVTVAEPPERAGPRYLEADTALLLRDGKVDVLTPRAP